MRMHVTLEGEAPPPPREQEVDRLFYLNPNEVFQLGPRNRSILDQYFAQLLVSIAVLYVDCLFELFLGDASALVEDVAQPVATIHNCGVADAPVIEEYVAQAGPVGDRQTTALPPQRQQLKHIRQ